MAEKIWFKKYGWSYLPINFAGWMFVFFVVLSICLANYVILIINFSSSIEEVLDALSFLLIFSFGWIVSSRHV